MRVKTPVKIDDKLIVPAQNLDLQSRINITSRRMERQETQRVGRLKSKIIEMSEVMNAFLSSSSIGEKSRKLGNVVEKPADITVGSIKHDDSRMKKGITFAEGFALESVDTASSNMQRSVLGPCAA